MIQRYRLCAMTAAVLGLLASANASALESGFYIGAVAGQTSIDVDTTQESDPRIANYSYSVDDSDNGYGIFFGGQFGRWFAVESQLLHLGEYREQIGFSVTNFYPTAPRNLDISESSSFEAAAFTLSGILTVPIGEQFAIGVRLGAAVSAAEISYEYAERRGNAPIFSESESNDAEASDINATYGISFEWAPTAHFGLRLEYQRLKDIGSEDDDYDYEEYDEEEEHEGQDIDLISLGLIGRF